ncbi:hypothetical protein PUN4_130232 [Paraburkholderia unamae]|nr:hypothetical protein PUN4_130232 [Paraburkholderia unamae]
MSIGCLGHCIHLELSLMDSNGPAWAGQNGITEIFNGGAHERLHTKTGAACVTGMEACEGTKVALKASVLRCRRAWRSTAWASSVSILVVRDRICRGLQRV